ncbi:hypothetical protein [Imbroritus primus]|uniref:hypothetical protein n=1 Tax=Imbroritus primus TaxID=3058603 RepID=UPI003D16068A
MIIHLKLAIRTSMNQLSDAFEDLSHALRVLLEANARAHGGGLLEIDRAEAVGNIEMGLGAVFNSFHSLYDALDKAGQGKLIDWYGTPQLSTILVLRNARHHNQARKIRTIYSYYVQEAEKIGRMEMYVLVDFPAEEEGADTFDVYLSWADLRILLAMPEQQSRLREAVAQSIGAYIGVEKFKGYAQHFQLEEDRVFFNVVPLLVNAAIELIPRIKHLVRPRSTESEVVLRLFDHILPAKTSEHEVSCGPIAYVD